jgi:hypothetical protein
MGKIRSRVGKATITVVGISILCLMPVGWHIVDAAHPWIKPTAPDVRLKP